MRAINYLVRILRQLLLDIDELKTTQFVGTNQIRAKYYEKPSGYDLQFSVTAPYQAVGSAHRTIKLTVVPQNMPAGNILLADVAADIVYPSGTRFSNWNSATNSISYNAFYSVVPINPSNPSQNEYLIQIVAPTNTILRLKVGILANADVDFYLQELN